MSDKEQSEVVRQRFTEDQREFIYKELMVVPKKSEVIRRFNRAYVETGERNNALTNAVLDRFLKGKLAQEERESYLKKLKHDISSLPFGNSVARIIKCGQWLADSQVGMREKVSIIKHILEEERYISDELRSMRKEPVTVLKMQAIDDEDPLLENPYFTTTEQMMMKMAENYSGKSAKTLKDLTDSMTRFKEAGGDFPWEEK